MNPLTQKGIDAFRSGDKISAQNLFRQALQDQPNDETAWLWLAGTFEDRNTRIHCLQKVLAINPANLAAQKGLAQLATLEAPPTPPPPPEPVPAAPAEPPPVSFPATEESTSVEDFTTNTFGNDSYESESSPRLDQGSSDFNQNAYTAQSDQQVDDWAETFSEEPLGDEPDQDQQNVAGGFAESIFSNQPDQKEDDWLRNFTDDTFLEEMKTDEGSGPGSLADAIFGSEPDQKEDDWLRSFSDEAYLNEPQTQELSEPGSLSQPAVTDQPEQKEDDWLSSIATEPFQEEPELMEKIAPESMERQAISNKPEHDDEDDWVNIFAEQPLQKESRPRPVRQGSRAGSSLQTSEQFDQNSRDHMLQADEEDLHIRALHAKPLSKGRYAIQIPGFEDHEILLKPTMLSAPRLLFDGKTIKKDKSSKLFILTSNEGLITKINLRPGLLDPLPKVWVDDEKLTLAPPLKWYQWVWMGIPLVALIVLGGAIGAFFGVLAMTINIKVFRSRLPMALRYVLTIIITLLAVALYLAAATYLPALLQDFTSSF